MDSRASTRRRRGRGLQLLLVLCVVFIPTHPAFAESLRVESLSVVWETKNGLLPPTDSLEQVPVKLRRSDTGLTSVQPGAPAITTDVAAINRMGGEPFTIAGLFAISEAIVDHLAGEGLIGVTVTPMQRGTSADLYLVASLPLEGSRPNDALPTDLRALRMTAEPRAPGSTVVDSWILTSATARWVHPDPMLVAAESVLSVPVRLGERDGVYTSPRKGRRTVSRSIRQFVKDGTRRFDANAVDTMAMAVADHLRRQGFDDAKVAPVITRDEALELVLRLQDETTPSEDQAPPTDRPDEVPDDDDAQDIAPPARPPSDPTDPAPVPEREDPARAADPTMEGDPEVDEEPLRPLPDLDGSIPYNVLPFEIAYKYPHPDLPPIEGFMAMPIYLTETEEGWIAPREGHPVIKTTLDELNGSGGGTFWGSAIATVTTAISRVLVDDDLLGVFVIPDPDQISAVPGSVGADLRPPDQTELTILITVGRVVETRTVAQGDRIPESEQVNHGSHVQIPGASPIKPHDPDARGESGGDAPRGDLLRQTELSDYIHLLNRHPGRQVEASVAAASVPGGVSLDFLVFEPKPLTLYYEVGNTGTPQENGLRQRFGLFHTQFTGNDDVLSLEYVTSNFAITNAVLGSYQFRVTEDNRIRAGILGSWNKFVNDQFGDDFVDFTGYSWSGGGQLNINVYQDGPFFLDVVPGVNFQKIKVSNEVLGESGQAGFLLPYVQLQASRQDDRGLMQAMVGFEGSPLSQDLQELTLLGRFDPSERWARLNWSASLSTFLEPLLDYDNWSDLETPESSTLAHELALRFSGQYAFGSRLVPQFQSIMGGLFSVRGYAQSVVAGDNAVFGSVEYRFHIPRTFAVQPEPIEFMGGPFRAAPQNIYGRPDWDLILKAFFDAGYVSQNGNQAFEVDNTLLGAGIGMEFLYKSNLRVRMDWGFALNDLKFGLAEAGTSRLYVTGTFLW